MEISFLEKLQFTCQSIELDALYAKRIFVLIVLLNPITLAKPVNNSKNSKKLRNVDSVLQKFKELLPLSSLPSRMFVGIMIVLI